MAPTRTQRDSTIDVDQAVQITDVLKAPVAAAVTTDVTSMDSRIEFMRKYFADQPKEWIRIRPEDGDQTVQVNGYTFLIKAGERVQVPVDIAELLQNANII